MNKVNCWEHMHCGRQPGGMKTQELGVCPVSTSKELNGAHGGTNAGRACWVIAGTLCNGKIQGSFAQKLSGCWRCEFFNTVKICEETSTTGFTATRLGIEKQLERRKSAGS